LKLPADSLYFETAVVEQTLSNNKLKFGKWESYSFIRHLKKNMPFLTMKMEKKM
jgi:hypothetical protein